MFGPPYFEKKKKIGRKSEVRNIYYQQK